MARVWRRFVHESCLPCGSEFTILHNLVSMGDDVTRSRSIYQLIITGPRSRRMCTILHYLDDHALDHAWYRVFTYVIILLSYRFHRFHRLHRIPIANCYYGLPTIYYMAGDYLLYIYYRSWLVTAGYSRLWQVTVGYPRLQLVTTGWSSIILWISFQINFSFPGNGRGDCATRKLSKWHILS